MKNILYLFVFSFLFYSCSKEDEIPKSDASNFISFEIKELENVTFTINSDKSITAQLPNVIDLSSLTAVFKVSEKARVFIGSTIQTSGYTKNDFSTTVGYIVEAEDGSISNYTIDIVFEPKLLSFSIDELPMTVFTIENTSLMADVSWGTERTNLTASFNHTEGDNLFVNGVQQISGETKNDFNSPLVYELKRDGKVQKQYTIRLVERDNIPPIANAGDDKIVFLTSGSSEVTVTLNGGNSNDTEGDIVSYQWESNGVIIGQTEIIELSLAIGVHNISLTVADEKGDTDTDEIIISVQEMGTYLAVDPDASAATQNLLSNLAVLANTDKFAFGQEFPMSFQLNELRIDLSTSDCKDVTGDHPGVFGLDFHYFMYKSNDQRDLHIREAKYAYENGAVVTFDFHQQSRFDNKIYFNEITNTNDKSLMYDIVNNLNGSRDWYFEELDQTLSIINNDLGFPIVYRLFHEMNGDWFWWGTKATNHSADLFVKFFQMTVDYIKERTNLVLFAWTPNRTVATSYYPGDGYVDFVGIDFYDPVRSALTSGLIDLTVYAAEHNKVAILSETGKNGFINTNKNFWNDIVLGAIQDGAAGIKIAWSLAWFNAPWKTSQSDLFIPNSNSEQDVIDNFKLFKQDEQTLFLNEINELQIYN